MKLRNKKTGEIFDWSEDIMPYGFGLPHPKSLAELNAEWEDYKPAEPLIKDELARKAIRAWAEANSLRCDDKVEARTPTVDCCVLGLTHGFTSIDVIVNEETSLKDYSRYTIEELCGEEEE